MIRNLGCGLIVSLQYKPDARARESSNAAAHRSLARRACMDSLPALRELTLQAFGFGCVLTCSLQVAAFAQAVAAVGDAPTVTQAAPQPRQRLPPAPGSYYNVTLGLNWHPRKDLRIRPEIRRDWQVRDSNTNRAAFDDGTSTNQWLLACDVLLEF